MATTLDKEKIRRTRSPYILVHLTGWQLQELELADCKIGVDGAEEIAETLTMRAEHNLSLQSQSCQSQSEQWQCRVDLANNGIDDKSAEKLLTAANLARVIRLPKLAKFAPPNTNS